MPKSRKTPQLTDDQLRARTEFTVGDLCDLAYGEGDWAKTDQELQLHASQVITAVLELSEDDFSAAYPSESKGHQNGRQALRKLQTAVFEAEEDNEDPAYRATRISCERVFQLVGPSGTVNAEVMPQIHAVRESITAIQTHLKFKWGKALVERKRKSYKKWKAREAELQQQGDS